MKCKQQLKNEMDRTMRLMSLDEGERLLRAFEADLTGREVDDADHTSPAQMVSLQAAGRFSLSKTPARPMGLSSIQIECLKMPEKLSVKQVRAIDAILSEPTLGRAALKVGVNERTLRLWLHDLIFLLRTAKPQVEQSGKR